MFPHLIVYTVLSDNAICLANGISIGSAVFVQLTRVKDAGYVLCVEIAHIWYWCQRCGDAG